MDNNYEIAINNLEKLYRHYELQLPIPEREVLEWSLLYLKDKTPDYRSKVIRQ